MIKFFVKLYLGHSKITKKIEYFTNYLTEYLIFKTFLTKSMKVIKLLHR